MYWTYTHTQRTKLLFNVSATWPLLYPLLTDVCVPYQKPGFLTWMSIPAPLRALVTGCGCGRTPCGCTHVCFEAA